MAPTASAIRPVRPSPKAASVCARLGRKGDVERSALMPASAEGEVVDIEGTEDVEPLRAVPSPQLLAAEQVEDHRRDHVPYRD